MRKPFIAGNWKMFKTVHETVVYIKELRAAAQDVRDVESSSRRRSPRACGGRGGARQQHRGRRRRMSTGSARARSPARSARRCCAKPGAEYVIIGHSERRTLFGETDLTVNRKLAAALGRGLDADRVRRRDRSTQRDANETLAVLDRQLQRRARRLHRGAARRRWCSRTSRSGRSAPAATRRRSRRRKRTRTSAAGCASGSAPTPPSSAASSTAAASSPDNIAALMAQPDVDGALVGGASLDARGFAEIVRPRVPRAGVRRRWAGAVRWPARLELIY